MSRMFLTRGGRQSMSSPAVFHRWHDLPYGAWVCPDGREVLFNRFYEPLMQRLPGRPAEAADPHERVGFARQRYFYAEASERAMTAAASQALIDWLAGETVRLEPAPAPLVLAGGYVRA